MMLRNPNTVLSFSPNPGVLSSRGSVLRRGGLEVISVRSEPEARFEIEMGRCGVLLMCFRTSAAAALELTELFRRNCPDGRIIFVIKKSADPPPFFADAVIPEQHETARLVEVVRGWPTTRAG
jgi:hypothetical protein